MAVTPYRPRNPGHGYYDCGLYLMLRWARKVQVQCHRQHPVSHIPYETTDDFALQHDAWAGWSLLILATWYLDTMGEVAGVPADSSYSRFHNLNTLAAEICAFEGETMIIQN